MIHAQRSLLIVFLAAVVGCGGGKLPEDQAKAKTSQELPPDHPPVGGGGPMAGGMGGDAGPTDGNALPLKLTGLNSVVELQAGLAEAGSDDAKAAFEAGFRKVFTADQQKRDYAGAVVDLEKALAANANFAHAYRALGYARFNQGFNVQAALENYQKAVELEPEYGEAHYALAFMYAMNDLDKGAGHFKKAMELGVPDERNLGERYYQGR